jgi:hypothetical protein
MQAATDYCKSCNLYRDFSTASAGTNRTHLQKRGWTLHDATTLSKAYGAGISDMERCSEVSSTLL